MPVNDFSFNMLSYDGISLKSESDQYSTKELLRQIKYKYGTVLQSYKNLNTKYASMCKLRIEKFKNNGYTLSNA